MNKKNLFKHLMNGLLVLMMLQTVFIRPKTIEAALDQAIPTTSAKSSIIIDAVNGQILFEQDSEVPV